MLWGSLFCLAQDKDSIGDATTASPTSQAALVNAQLTSIRKQIKKTVRGFDRLDTAYIEPQHYIFTVMLQATNNYDWFTLRSAGPDVQSVTFSPDMNIRLGPFVGWKWFFAGYTFELGNINLAHIKQQLDLSIYSSQIGIDLFFNRIKAFTHITSLAQKATVFSKKRRGVMLVT